MRMCADKTDRKEYMKEYMKVYRKSEKGKKARLRANFNYIFSKH